MIFRIAIVVFLVLPALGSAQIFEALEHRSFPNFKWTDIEVSMSDSSKMQLLTKVYKEDTLEFTDHYEGGLYPLDTSGLHYLDLDFDGDLDLIYQSISGNMGMRSSKIYLQVNEEFEMKGRIEGRIIRVQLKPQLEIISYIHPCCDSYTNGIRIYGLDKEIVLSSNIVFIGLAHEGMRGIPDLTSEESWITHSTKLFMSPIDLRSGGYFRKRTREIQGELRSGNFVMSAELPNNIKIEILDSAIVRDSRWYLIITDPISKPNNSLYEDWQTRQISKSRYMGWTMAQGLRKK